MNEFFGIPVLCRQVDEVGQYMLEIRSSEIDIVRVRNSIERNRLTLIRSISFSEAASLFQELVHQYGIGSSFDLQMQYVAHMLKDRTPIDNVAVSVNERGPLQIIQPHSEGDSTSPLDLFGLYCLKDAPSGGHNLLSLIDQDADHSRLRAKEKVIVAHGLSAKELASLRLGHLDAKSIVPECSDASRVLVETSRGKVVVRVVPVSRAVSAINGEKLVTYWDNVTVHDNAFHHFLFELLNHVGILNRGNGCNYRDYMHVEEDSNWAPADTQSGDIGQTSRLFRCHIIHKMKEGDFLIFHNRAWTHAVNNWIPGEERSLRAMYA